MEPPVPHRDIPSPGPDAFGFVRLLFASLVIVSHTPELIDGDRSREILTRMFGTLSFGELAVDGFFIVSGFLITGSFLSTRSVPMFAAKRAVRLFPGFWLATAFCVLVVVPLGGGSLARMDWPDVILDALLLKEVKGGGAFVGLPDHNLNGSMWSLALEARCYVIVALLGVAGALRRPALLVGLAAGLLIAQMVVPDSGYATLRSNGITRFVLAEPANMLRLTAQFLAGAALWHFRDRLRPTPWRTALASVGLIAGLSHPVLAEPAVATFGAWLTLSLALRPPAAWMAKVNRRDDVSYGVYLYAWPVTNLLIWYGIDAPLVVVTLLTFAISFVLGWLSWRNVERPAQRLFRRWLDRRADRVRVEMRERAN